nr:LysR substrate-binding domain-containing protein [Kaustia mangrovi]
MFRFTLKQCSYFAAVAEHGGIAQAARALNVSQPAVAFALDKLEAALELTLLERHHARGVSLTPQGEEFLALARKLLASAEAVDSAARGLSVQMDGALSVGCLDTLAPFYLPGLVKAFRTYFPNVELAASEQQREPVVAGLRDGRFEAVIAYESDMADQPDLVFDAVASVQPRVILPSDHALASRKVVSLKLLERDPYVALDLPCLKSYFDRLLERAEIAPPTVLSSPSLEVVRSAVGNGLGFSLIALQPQADLTYDGKAIAARPIREQTPPLQIVVGYPREAPDTELRQQFISFCRDFFADRSVAA